MRICYKAGYKYRLMNRVFFETKIRVKTKIDTQSIMLERDGRLTLREGYAWDGPSGPAIDTLNFMRASLAHDALYQLMALGLLNIQHRKTADRLMRDLCLEDGMSRFRVWYTYHLVRRFGDKYARNQKPIYMAPKE